MPRTVRNAKIDTPSARARLKQRREPYWTVISTGCAIGYRKGSTGGTWIARYYSAARTRPMTYHAIGAADDAMAADGVAALSYGQAQAAAQAWCAREARIAEGLEPVPAGPYKVADAIEDYLKQYRRTGKAVAGAELTINAHILPALGDVQVDRLTTARIEEWKQLLAEAPARLRRKQTAKKLAHRPAARTADEKRARRASANRILTVLKAALNQAWKTGKTVSDDAWRRVAPFRNVDDPVVRHLSVAECRRLVNACTVDLRLMVQAALFSGCRYGEITALVASDFNQDAGMLTIRESKSGKPRHIVLTDEGRQFFKDATAGKASDALMFVRSDGEKWGTNHQRRPLTAACKRAKIAPVISFHVLRHTYASLMAMNGAPMQVIAQQLGHADTRMTEKHYAHLAPNYVAEAVRAAFPTLGITETKRVQALR